MKRTNQSAWYILTISFFLFFTFNSQAQDSKKPKASLKASVSQTIGIDTEIEIEYSRPGVKGRKIWGDLVPYGLAAGNKESDNKPFPWRGGANESTTFEVSKDVMIDGKKLPAGKYSLHFIPSEKDWVIIFNKDANLWGSYKLDKEKDALRINVNPKEAPFMEWLTYGFDELDKTSCTAYLWWEKLKVPFKISTAE